MADSIVAYFITVLLYFPAYTGPIPNAGWMQWAFPFPNQTTCEQFLEEQEEEFIILTLKRFGDVPVEIKDVDCLTYAEALKRNRELGHKGDFGIPEQQQPERKTNPFKGLPSA